MYVLLYQPTGTSSLPPELYKLFEKGVGTLFVQQQQHYLKKNVEKWTAFVSSGLQTSTSQRATGRQCILSFFCRLIDKNLLHPVFRMYPL